jgi:hypothetical protein
MNRPGSRRITVTVAALPLFVGAAAILTGGLADAHRAKRATPRLVLVHRSPVTVAGGGFKARRRVRVTLSAGRTSVRRPLANGRGAFTVTFASSVIDRCTAWSASASQQHLSVVLRGRAKPECAPASTP